MTFAEVLVPDEAGAIPVTALHEEDVDGFAGRLPLIAAGWLKASGFTGAAGKWISLPDADGTISGVVFGLGAKSATFDPFSLAVLATSLPEATYRLEAGPVDARLAALGWLLEAYRFDRYRKPGDPPARLVCPDGVDRDDVLNMCEAVALTRDLINTPAEDMGPDEVETAARMLANSHGADVTVISGQDLESGFPLIHAVGRASHRLPRLIDLTWGAADAPRVTLVGKGVCFDTGGLDIKPANAMLLMKKDMGGAANVLGLASMIMAAGLKVRLRVLVPAVENAVAGNAFRPGDVFHSRAGKTVEIGNTDAEGRLVLADALDLADSEEPDLLIDMATLTGAARVALGPELAPFYCDDEAAASALAEAGIAERDPLWRMPFWDGYEAMLKSGVADMNNVGGGGFAGSITAALFLRRFVARARTYMHFDVYGWTPAAKPAAPQGGQAHAIRALFRYVRERYGQ